MEIERADPRARRLAVTLLIVGAALGVLLFVFAEWRLPSVQEWVIEDPRQAQGRLRVVATGLTAVFAVPTLLFAAYFWKLGARVIRSNRFPPPGMRVIRDTVVRNGPSARRTGRILQAMALMLTFTVGGLLTIALRLMSLFRSRSKRDR